MSRVPVPVSVFLPFVRWVVWARRRLVFLSLLLFSAGAVWAPAFLLILVSRLVLSVVLDSFARMPSSPYVDIPSTRIGNSAG